MSAWRFPGDESEPLVQLSDPAADLVDALGAPLRPLSMTEQGTFSNACETKPVTLEDLKRAAATIERDRYVPEPFCWHVPMAFDPGTRVRPRPL